MSVIIPWNRVVLEGLINSRSAVQVIPSLSLKHECPLPCSQEAADGLYPESAKSIPMHSSPVQSSGQIL
jgi:hypothetical protein